MGDSRTHSKDSAGDDAVKEKEVPEIEGLLQAESRAVPDSDVKVPLSLEEAPPRDHYYLVYIILLIHGIGVLMPWNMFITANDYFVNYKLMPAVSGNETDGEEGEENENVYRDYFLSSLCFVAQIPNVLLNILNLFFKGKGGNTSIRVIACILVIIAVFFFTVVLAIVDSSSWPAAFFWITMISVVVINSANGVYQNNVYGLAACLPMKYTNAVVIGSNVSGAITAFIALFSMLLAPSIRLSAIFYFLTAIVVLLVALGTFIVLKKNPYYKYYANKNESQASGSKDEGVSDYLAQYLKVFKMCWKEDLCVFLVFFVTLSCFPAIQAGVVPVSGNFVIPADYFTIVTCFVFFNLFAVIGSSLTTIVQLPGPRWTWLAIVLRLLFIPFFMFCNFRPHVRHLPVLITNDYVYCIGGILMAFSSGYLSSLAMMFAPRKVGAEHKGIAGMMAALFLVLGIFAGIIFSFPLIAIIEKLGPGPVHHHLHHLTGNSTDVGV